MKYTQFIIAHTLKKENRADQTKNKTNIDPLRSCTKSSVSGIPIIFRKEKLSKAI